MTVKQLLDSLSFDEIAPYIPKNYEGRKDTESVLASFKQHYDYLRHLVPTDPGQTERMELPIGCYTDEKGTYLDAFWAFEGELWEDTLSRELVIDKKVKAGNAEIAACIMLQTAFYGYLPYERQDEYSYIWFGSLKNRKARFRAYKEKFAKVIPSDKDIMAVPSFHNEVRSELKVESRKRERRSRKRKMIRQILFDRIMLISTFIEDILERGQNIGETPSLQELGILYHSNHLARKHLESTAFNATKRFDYLKELIVKYHAMAVIREWMSEHSNSFICMSASSEYPVTEKEKTLAKILTEGLSGKHQLCIKVDESCGEELRIDIAVYDLGNSTSKNKKYDYKTIARLAFVR